MVRLVPGLDPGNTRFGPRLRHVNRPPAEGRTGSHAIHPTRKRTRGNTSNPITNDEPSGAACGLALRAAVRGSAVLRIAAKRVGHQPGNGISAASRATSSMASWVFLDTRPPAFSSSRTFLASIVFL